MSALDDLSPQLSAYPDAIRAARARSGLTNEELAERWVSIPDYIMALIRAQGRTEGPFVTVTGDAVYKRFIKTLDRAGIPRCRFHDLRHANAAVMVRLGVDSKYAQERNGWASDRMYKQTYAYVMADQMDEVDKSIDGYFVNKMTTQNPKTTE